VWDFITINLPNKENGIMDWKALKNDVTKGLKEGFLYVKAGAGVAAKKAGKLTKEGQKRIEIFRIKHNIHELMADLGADIYKVEGASPTIALSASMKGVIKKIKAAEKKLSAVEKRVIR
jgi:hypothetical protein